MKKLFSFILTLLMLGGYAIAQEYVDPVTGASYQLEDEHFVYREGNSVIEGRYEIGYESQQILFTPMGQNWSVRHRYYDDMIFGGTEWEIENAWDFNLFFGMDTFYFLGIENYSVSGVEAQPLRYSGARIYLIEGNLYYGDIFKDEAFKRNEETEDIVQWVERAMRDGEAYYVGRGEIYENFIICAFTKDFLKSADYADWRGEIKGDMILGAWTESYGYTVVYFPRESTREREITKIYQQLREECELPYQELVGR